MFTNFFRVFRLGWHEISRNIGVSLGTIFVMFIALSLIVGTFLAREMSENLITMLEEKVDVSVYFLKETSEEKILTLKERLENFPQVKKVEFISEEKALENFKERNKDNPLYMESLAEIGGNPLSASLNIRADTASSYAMLANFLEKGDYQELIDKKPNGEYNINYRETQAVIERLFSISDSIRKGGLTVSVILIFIAFLVTFNTIRLGIYSKREEIETMKLIGATNWFVRGPFVVEGILIGLLAGIFSFALFYGVDSFVMPESLGVFGELGFLNFFEANILILLAMQIGGGVFLGMFSSFFATQLYLKS